MAECFRSRSSSISGICLPSQLSYLLVALQMSMRALVATLLCFSCETLQVVAPPPLPPGCIEGALPIPSQFTPLSSDATLEKRRQNFLFPAQNVLCGHAIINLSEEILDLGSC